MNKQKLMNVILAMTALAGAGTVVSSIIEMRTDKKLQALYEEHLELAKQLDKDCADMYDTAKSLVNMYTILYNIENKDKEVQDEEPV